MNILYLLDNNYLNIIFFLYKYDNQINIYIYIKFLVLNTIFTLKN